MTTFQFFSLIQGLNLGALSENYVLENAFSGGTIRTCFSPKASVDKKVVPGSYIWIWADDSGDVDFINDFIYQTLGIGDDVLAEWIVWNKNAEPKRNYILLVEKMIIE